MKWEQLLIKVWKTLVETDIIKTWLKEIQKGEKPATLFKVVKQF